MSNSQKLSLAVCLMLMALKTPAAQAATTITPDASVTVEHNSNVFDLPGAGVDGITALGDTIDVFGAGLNGNFTFGPDALTLGGEVKHVIYDRYTYLNHNEYAGNARVDWHFGPVVETILNYNQSLTLASFADTLSTVKEENTDRTVELRIRLLVTPVWAIELIPKEHEGKTPLPGYPGFEDKETWGSLAVNYLGITNLTTGLRFDYVRGNYSGIADATQYDQRTAEVTATYKLTGKSNFTGDLGYTTRSNSIYPAGSVMYDPTVPAPYLPSTSGFTGTLNYNLELTAKTGINIGIFRNIQSFAGGANTQLGTGAQVGLHWAPDFRFAFELNGQYAHNSIEGVQIITDAVDRDDRFIAGEFKATYAAFKWLNISAFVNENRRTSNLAIAGYDATVYGITFAAKLQ